MNAELKPPKHKWVWRVYLMLAFPPIFIVLFCTLPLRFSPTLTKAADEICENIGTGVGMFVFAICDFFGIARDGG